MANGFSSAGEFDVNSTTHRCRSVQTYLGRVARGLGDLICAAAHRRAESVAARDDL
jgi:hypothetical protein